MENLNVRVYKTMLYPTSALQHFCTVRELVCKPQTLKYTSNVPKMVKMGASFLSVFLIALASLTSSHIEGFVFHKMKRVRLHMPTRIAYILLQH